MDRYFYTVMMDGDQKLVHLSGNVYFNDADETERCYRLAEWTFFYMTIEEVMELVDRLRFYEYVNERINYLSNLTRDEAIDVCREYFNGNSGQMLHIVDVNKDTPCGDYWF